MQSFDAINCTLILAGVFGPLPPREPTAADDDNDDDTKPTKAAKEGEGDEEVIEPPPWSINRKTLEGELEAKLKTKPFESYELIRGQVNGLFGSTVKVVATFKCIVRVVLSKDEPPLVPLDLLFKPKVRPDSFLRCII